MAKLREYLLMSTSKCMTKAA